MQNTRIKTAWMWQDVYSGGVRGVTVDVDDGTLQWFDEPGCACGSSDAVQTIADFLNNGARGGSPPADVLDEMRDNLGRFTVDS